MSPGTFDNLVRTNVLDIRFTRRRPRASRPATRRMLCTLSSDILMSVNGRTVLNYLPPGKNMPYTTNDKGLSLVWDIMMQDFRMVGTESVSIIAQYNTDNTFWEYFNENILSMDSASKVAFMNS